MEGALTKSIKGAAYVAHAFGRYTRGMTHMLEQPCPICNENCMRAAMVDLVYTHEVCRCEECPDYAHLVQRMWHRQCFLDAQGVAPQSPDSEGER